jgi:hypothetical protein
MNKIFLDIGHPAHVHYFRNVITQLVKEDYRFCISARNREVIHTLLDNYHLSYFDRGKGGEKMISKFFYLFLADYGLFKKARSFKPDLFLSFASPYAAHVSKLLSKPHIVLDDTESAGLNHKLYLSSSDTVLTPKSFKKDLGDKQIHFDSFMELSYLHPKYFTPTCDVFNMLGLLPDEKYSIIRFVSWNANHDVGQKGLDLEKKKELVEKISKVMKVFITSEEELPSDLKKYQIQISPDKLHDALAFASLYVGEGATTASECAMLGTPAIYVNSLSAGTLEEQEKMGLLFNLRNSDNLFSIVDKILSHSDFKSVLKKKREKMLKEKIDLTAFLTWFVRFYPKSMYIIKENPDYQYRFRYAK